MRRESLVAASVWRKSPVVVRGSLLFEANRNASRVFVPRDPSFPCNVPLHMQRSDLKPALLAEIKQLLVSELNLTGRDPSTIEDEAPLFGTGGLGLDSLDALQIAMMSLRFKPGDEVILPVFTYVATAEVMALLKLVPVFADVDEKSLPSM